MDVMMRNMDGYETTRQIREISADLPIIGLTALASSEEPEKCKEAGMTDYLSKPYTMNDLVAVIMKNLTSSPA